MNRRRFLSLAAAAAASHALPVRAGQSGGSWQALARRSKRAFMERFLLAEMQLTIERSPLVAAPPGPYRAFLAPREMAYRLPAFTADVNGDGVLDGLDVQDSAAGNAFSIFDPRHRPALDPLALGLRPENDGSAPRDISSERRAQSDLSLNHAVASNVPYLPPDTRPKVGAAFYVWYLDDADWTLAQDLPLPGLYNKPQRYRSDDQGLFNAQMRLMAVSGVDFVAFSSFDTARAVQLFEQYIGAHPGTIKAAPLFEHLNQLPLPTVDGLPTQDYNDPAMRAEFVRVAEQIVRPYEALGRENLMLFADADGTEYLPLWMWASNVMRGHVFRAVADYNATHDLPIALIGSEQPAFPPELYAFGEREQHMADRAEAFLFMMPYANYDPVNTAAVDGRLNDELRRRLIDGTLDLAKFYGRRVRRGYDSRIPPAGVSLVPTFKDFRGNPELRATDEDVRRLFERQYVEVVRQGQSPAVSIVWNEWYEGTTSEPSVRHGFRNLYYMKRVYGASDAGREVPERMVPVY